MSAREPNDDAAPGLLGRVLMVRREERGIVLLAILYFFLVLASYQVLRPIREQMGIAGGTSNLKYLWTFTLAGSAVASALFAKLSSAVPRRRFLPITYRVCAVCILAFGGLLTQLEGEARIRLGYVFYVWLAVYAFFGVSVFWSFMADIFGLGQARRLFGTFAIGGTLGALLGASINSFLVVRIGVPWLFVVAAGMLELCVWCIGPLARRAASATESAPEEDSRLGGGALEGWKLISRSSYLANIALFTFLFYFVQTFAVRQQADIVTAEVIGRELQTRYYANVDIAQQSLTLFVQLFVTGRVMKALGVIGGLTMLPVICVGGFLALASAHAGAAPSLAVVTVFLVLLKGLSHAAMRPAREALFVLATRREKYQAKSVNDTFVARGGDLGAAWVYDGIKVVLDGSLRGLAFAALPLAMTWAAVAFWLGVRNRRMTREPDAVRVE